MQEKKDSEYLIYTFETRLVGVFSCHHCLLY